jgi:hypothetical protein
VLQDGIMDDACLPANFVGFSEKQLGYSGLLVVGKVGAQVLQQHLSFFEATHGLVEHTFHRLRDLAEQSAHRIGVARMAAVAN